MKATRFLKIGLILIAAAGLSLTGCQKEKQKDNSPDSSTLQQLSQDDNYVENVNDEAMNDVNTLTVLYCIVPIFLHQYHH